MYNRPWRSPLHWIVFAILGLVAFFVVATIVFWVFVGPGLVVAGSYPYYPFGFGWIWIFLVFFLFFGLFRFAFRPWGWGYRRYGYGYGYGAGRENEAYHILRERYARGEITKDQYDAMMKDLYQPPQVPPGH